MNLIKLIPFSIRERIRKIVFGKNHFHDVVEYLAAIAPGAKVFDVGAQRGYETILCAKAGMRLWAFEPNVKAMDKLLDNVYYEGVGSKVNYIQRTVSNFDNAEDDIITLDNVMRQYKVRPDFLKIDTDGSDLKVLEGYPFHLHRPLILSVEYDNTGAVDRKLLSEGYKLIYAIYKPQTRARRAIFSRYSLSPEFYGQEWGDVIALLPEYYEEFRDKIFQQ